VILYAVVAGESPNDLFAAGLIPGLLMMVLIAIWGVVTGIRQKAPRQPFSLSESVSALWEAKWEVLIPIILYSLFLGGITTIIETAALALLAAMVTQSLVFRDLHWRSQLPETMARAGVLVGAVVVLLGVAMGLTSYLVDAEIPTLVLEWTKSHIHSPMVFLLVLNGLLLVLGSVLEIYSAIIVLAPLLTPLAAAYGINPLHLGIVFLANLELGFLFPPMGLNLILSSSRFNQPLVRLYKVTLPFMAILAVGVLLITYIPAMTVGMSKQSEKSTDQPKRSAE
jgi:tripartite ATP-independent transporter DctM subunit